MVKRLELRHRMYQERLEGFRNDLWAQQRIELQIILGGEFATAKQHALLEKINKLAALSEHEITVPKGSPEYKTLPLERKAKWFIIDVYMMR